MLPRNCGIEGGLGVMGKWGRRRKQALGDLKEMTLYWKLKEESLRSTLWRSRLGRGYGPFVRQTTK
jgi:hypothetical protein